MISLYAHDAPQALRIPEWYKGQMVQPGQALLIADTLKDKNDDDVPKAIAWVTENAHDALELMKTRMGYIAIVPETVAAHLRLCLPL